MPEITTMNYEENLDKKMMDVINFFNNIKEKKETTFLNTIDANIELASAIAKIIKIAEYLKKDYYSDETKFEMAYDLAFVHLRNLKNYKISK